MSRALARIKLQEAQQALACLRSNIEGAAEHLSGEGDLRLFGAGLVLFGAGLDEMHGAIGSILTELDGQRPALIAVETTGA